MINDDFYRYQIMLLSTFDIVPRSVGRFYVTVEENNSRPGQVNPNVRLSNVSTGRCSIKTGLYLGHLYRDCTGEAISWSQNCRADISYQSQGKNID